MRETGKKGILIRLTDVIQGSFAASRVVGPGLTGGLTVNGSGMMNFGSQSVGNNPIRSSGFVSGNMTIRDFVTYGGRL